MKKSVTGTKHTAHLKYYRIHTTHLKTISMNDIHQKPNNKSSQRQIELKIIQVWNKNCIVYVNVSEPSKSSQKHQQIQNLKS